MGQLGMREKRQRGGNLYCAESEASELFSHLSAVPRYVGSRVGPVASSPRAVTHASTQYGRT